MRGEAVDLSVIVPAYEEAARLGAPLRAIGAWLARQPFRCEIVVVDDGSRDTTAAVAREAADGLTVPLTLLRCAENRGKGHALKVGFAAARGRRILFTDADLSTPIEAASDLLRALDAGADLAIGSRKAAGAEVAVHQPLLRELLGRGFTFLVRLAIAPVSDATCGFKAFAGDVGRDLFARTRIERWGFDAEILHLAHRRGLRIDEVPVRWEDRSGTKVRLASDVARSLADLARIRWLAARGHYASARPAAPPAEVWRGGLAGSREP